MDVFHTRQCPEPKNVHEQLGKGNNYREISGKFGVVASTAYDKVNKTGTDENLFRLVPVPGHGVRVLPLELVLGHQQEAMFRLLPVPGQHV